ncbi:L-threonylcarbamoyladenylate synthase [Tessaracoccus sp. OH4464_COT-324]|uniref:L-threonylcarbamoyladenylate synthase n=1 Tax=Tessaracoccus sp. OH4464_COT-324 TaxID=2491059 RepID=UPI000F6421EA|nr:L-threonylcarbamoyladenylate synthase [Tessaracoccus sp. OH4464_COT-324]RRD48016.1 threonylcarbamoyl-AMP synthase [Tessaracoccus sp. OH4464_COT-324]
MAKYLDVHPDNPQPRAIAQAAQILRDGGLIVYPTDSGFALGALLGNVEGIRRIKSIRQLDDKHNFTLVVDDFAKLGQYVEMDNWVFRAVKAATPGRYTFILKATREVPKMMQHPKKKTVGVRIPEHKTVTALLQALDQPLLTSTLLLPGDDVPPTDGWQIKELLDHQVEAVLDSGDVGLVATTVVDLTGDEPVVARHGAGDPTPFE